MAEFIKRVEYRSSLLMLSGHEIEDGTLYPMYEFRHLTIQEYLTARAIVEGYYPDRKDDDTLLSILKPHLSDVKWKEVVPLAAVLAGRKVQPLVQHLIALCKNLEEPHRDYSPQFPVVLLIQCILDEIHLAPKLLEEALEWIARRTRGFFSSHIISLFEGRYGEVMLKVVQNAYMNSDTDLANLGVALREIQLYKMGWTEKTKKIKSELFEIITDLLENENTIKRAISVLAIVPIAFFLYSAGTELSKESKNRLQVMGKKLLPSLYSKEPYLHFAACWAFSWLGEIGAWLTVYDLDVLSRLFEILKSSRLTDVQNAACWAISDLPIMDRDLKPLPEPDLNSINFIKEQSLQDDHFRQAAALVMGFYWKKPWTHEELAEKVKGVETGMSGWGRNKSLILKTLEDGKESARREAHNEECKS